MQTRETNAAAFGLAGQIALVIGEPPDVARAVLWPACDLSDDTTGLTLSVDSGMALYPSFRGGG